jgi:S1-C subfamily serine protease
MKRSISIATIIITASLLLGACNAGAKIGQAYATQGNGGNNQAVTQQATSTPSVGATIAVPTTVVGNTQSTQSSVPVTGANPAAAALESTLEDLYTKVNPSVVNIHVVIQSSANGNSFGFGNNPLGQGGQVAEALGSGFVWDKQGHIVTNNHVVDGASSVDVTFSDGLTVPAKVVGKDLNSDLAVIQVNVPQERLQPVTMADSTQVKVGELAVAIGNPFGLQGSMSMGIVSGLARTLPVGNDNQSSSSGQTYAIPDIIQTDAAVNPGNSGGVLVNDQGQVLGVTAAIDTNNTTAGGQPSGSGVGFVIPSVIVQKVVPDLIKSGHHDFSWLGISGATMQPEFAQPMNLNSDQRGVLVVEVTPGSPAAKAGIQGSTQQVTINGQQALVGGDVIVAANDQTVNTFEDLITYLAVNTNVGDKVTLKVLRNGKVQSVDVVLEARPATQQATGSLQPSQQSPIAGPSHLGISGVDVDSQIAQAMNLPTNLQGILIEQVQSGSAAQKAGLRAGNKSIVDNGTSITVGGDVIVAIDGQALTGVQDLQMALQQTQPGQTVTLTIIRNGNQRNIQVTLGSATSSSQ